MESQRETFIQSLSPTLVVVNLDYAAKKFDEFIVFHEDNDFMDSEMSLLIDVSKYYSELHDQVMEAVNGFTNTQIGLLFARQYHQLALP